MDKNNALFKNAKFCEDAIVHVSNRCKKEISTLVSNNGNLVTYGKNLEEAEKFSFVQFTEMLNMDNSAIAKIIGAVSIKKLLILNINNAYFFHD